MPIPHPVILVHGFTQTGASWAPVAPSLSAAGFDVHTPDVPVAPDLGAAATTLGRKCGAGTWMGYSMGGRIALHVALRSPPLVRALVLVGATAGIEDPVDRAARREHDEGQARMVERLGVGPFLDRWLAQPLFADLDPAVSGREARLTNSPATLAAHLRDLGTGTQEPLWSRLGELQMPVLVVAGQRDAKFVALGERLVEHIGGNASLELVRDAGHACHLERPDAFVATVLPFLEQARDQSASPTASSTP
jgi:2-succinyl-6-hydroxy-2,4-cyclohexadiene-1-carboxylate synthase